MRPLNQNELELVKIHNDKQFSGWSRKLIPNLRLTGLDYGVLQIGDGATDEDYIKIPTGGRIEING